jgi:hypothetical protein
MKTCQSVLVVVLALATFGIAQIRATDTTEHWLPFAPAADAFAVDSAIDLRKLNEPQAGDGGFIAARDGQFVHGRTNQPLRFWAVNVSPENLPDDAAGLRRTARILAKHGVNLVRIHGGYFNEDGSINTARIRKAQLIVQAMKAEGIYSHFSTYFPLWIQPKPGNPFLAGYDGKTHPFAALYFNRDFQKQYESWWAALLTSSTDGYKLLDDPAVMGAEIINEDSFLFWTFRPETFPEPQRALIETQFGDWLRKKYGSLDAAMHEWRQIGVKGDEPAAGRIAFRALYNIFSNRTLRDKDTAEFLLESQRAFYAKEKQFLKTLGFKGVVTASNWATASPAILGPLEKYSYTVCDFLDRHGYVSCGDKGPNSDWAIMVGQTYLDRSALRFDAETLNTPRQFVNPVMDVHYDDKPSMISETTFNRPSRYRSEAPLYFACYGALQHSDAIVHFVLDGSDWSVKPRYFMQPWTLMSPAMIGQFPAAALIYRKSLVAPGAEMAAINLKVADLELLNGTPLPQDAAFDELRARDLPQSGHIAADNVIDPLIHYVGATHVTFTRDGGPSTVADLRPFINRVKKTVDSSNHELHLDYGAGVLTINAPAAQGVSGNLHAVGSIRTTDLAIACDMDLAHIVVVSLDDKPIASSAKMLLQVMSEEQPTDWKTEDAGGLKRITNIGHDPWTIRQISGQISLTRSDAASLKVTALDANGIRLHPMGNAGGISLEPSTIYYLIER